MSKLIKTFNPYESLKQEQNKTSQELDFKILNYNTICTNFKTRKKKTYQEEDLNLFYSDEFFLDGFQDITQEFLIEMVPKNSKLFKFSFKSDKNLLCLKASLVVSSNLSYYTELKNDIFQELFKGMVKYKILIIRLDRNLDNNINNIVQAIKQGFKDKEYEIIISRGVDTQEGKIDEVKFHRHLDDKLDHTYDEKDYCRPVQKDELLFEYVLKIEGKKGKNLQGKPIFPKEIKFLNNPFKLKDQSIYEINFNDRIKYYSAKYGFLFQDNEGYGISNTLKVSQVGLKTTGTIKTDLDEDVCVEIVNNSIDDAVKSGIVNIQTSKVKINGNVGYTQLHGKTIIIQGATHAKSQIYGSDVFINIHKGFLQADCVYIKNLEQGHVKAKDVYIEKCSGAIIEADNIFIKDCLKGNKIYPRKKLIVENCMKDNNKIYFEYSDIEKSNKELFNFKDLSVKLEHSLKIVLLNLEKTYKYLLSEQTNFINAKKCKLLLSAYSEKLNKYNFLIEQYKELINLKFEISSKIDKLNEKMDGVKIHICTNAKIDIGNFICFNINKDEHKYNLASSNLSISFQNQNPTIKECEKYSEIELKEFSSVFDHLKQ